MNIVTPTISPARRSIRLFLAAAITCFFCSRGLAQETILPPAAPAPNSTGAASAFENESAPAPAPPPPAAVPASRDPSVELDGRPVAETPRRFKYNFGLTTRGVYDDNINISSTSRTSDYYIAIEPFISLNLGDPDDGFNSLNFVYRPSIFRFIDHTENDSVQHIIHLDGGRRFGHLSLSLSQNVQILDGQDLNSISDPTGQTANIDVGTRVTHQVYTSMIGGAYDLSGKIFLSGGGNFSADEYKTQISSQIYSGNVFVNYRYSDKVVLGVGGTGGLNTTDNSSPSNNDQTFEQANVRLTYTVTAKISLSASGGVEFRQFGGNSSGSYTSPVYDLTASYQPFDGTSLSLSGSRHTANSAVLTGQDFADTTINFSASQRLLRRFTVGFAVGYENNNYFSTVQGASANRTDNYYYIEPSLDASITRFWTAGAYYLYRQDDSSLQAFKFHDEQVGFRTSLSF